jgi:pimeloyl-ACP methyl ester carboxylesterase
MHGTNAPPLPRLDVVSQGAGRLVVLVHSSLSGARQWTRLMGELADAYESRAMNLFGYGGTPVWPHAAPPTLADYADAVMAAVPAEATHVSVVGHSFGGAAAMEVARRLGDRVDKLVLIEPSLFYLLRLHGRREAYDEIEGLSRRMDLGTAAPEAAAEQFITYWGGPDAWNASSDERRAAFIRGVPVVSHEWNAVFHGDTPREDWAELLPRKTMLLSSRAPKRPSREIMELLIEACPAWRLTQISDGGHMAPLTHPHLVNLAVRAFLDSA